MTYDFKCGSGHVTERFCVPVKEIEEGQAFTCPECGQPAFPAVVLNQGFQLLGNPDGYSKPSATKRHSYKKITENGNNG